MKDGYNLSEIADEQAFIDAVNSVTNKEQDKGMGCSLWKIKLFQMKI